MAAHGLRIHLTDSAFLETYKRWRLTEATCCHMGDTYRGEGQELVTLVLDSSVPCRLHAIRPTQSCRCLVLARSFVLIRPFVPVFIPLRPFVDVFRRFRAPVIATMCVASLRVAVDVSATAPPVHS